MATSDRRNVFLRYLYDHRIFWGPGIDFRPICEELGYSVGEFQADHIPILQEKGFIDGALGGKSYLTMAGINEVERLWKDDQVIRDSHSLRKRFLQRLNTHGNSFADKNVIRNELGMDENTLDFVTHVLIGNDCVEGGGPMGPSVRITNSGKLALENGMPV